MKNEQLGKKISELKTAYEANKSNFLRTLGKTLKKKSLNVVKDKR